MNSVGETTLEINLNALAHNFKYLKGKLGPTNTYDSDINRNYPHRPLKARYINFET